MNKTWRIARHEYARHVFTRRFLLGLLSVPLIILALVGLVFLILSMENSTRAVGYVDHSGLLAHPVPAPPVEEPDRAVEILAFADEAAARSALEADRIQIYFVLPPDYLTSGQISVVHVKPVKDPARYQFYAFLGANLLAGTDPAVAARLVDGSVMTIRTADGSRTVSQSDWFFILVPMISGIGFIIAMFTAGGYLMQAVVDEKENRTMEVLITSVSPGQFMAGKIAGDTAAGLTQILAWAGFVVVLVAVGSTSFEFLKAIRFAPQTLIVFAAVLFPAFMMFAGLMAVIGATVTEAREGQQVIGLISIPFWVPYMLTAALMSNPNSPLALALSFFPLTAPLTMVVRDGMTVLPAWQIATSGGILALAAAASIWIAGRAFRLGMLRYGKRLAWREIFARQGARS
jgi:ABC-2 type transport system permease protein